MMDWSLWTIKKLVVVAEFFAFLTLLSALSIGQSKPDRDPDHARINSKGELTSNSIRNNKSKYHYDDGGSYSCNTTLLSMTKTKAQDPCKEKELRDFIWAHYSSKQRGLAQISYFYIDAGRTEYLFVEPQSDGKWAVSWWSWPWSALPGSKTNAPTKMILSVNKVEGPSDGDWSLEFKDETGKTIQTLPYRHAN